MKGVRCDQCVRYLERHQWTLVGACASVGIEHGMTTLEALGVHMADYHRQGHR